MQISRTLEMNHRLVGRPELSWAVSRGSLLEVSVSVSVHSILLPLDGSPIAEQALPWAVELADRYSAQLILLRVAPRPEFWSPLDAPDTYLDEQETRAMKYLLGVESRLTDGKVPIQAEYSLGNPAQCILDRAKELGDCIIVMNSHGRDGVSRLMLGSVAEKVARHAACPVFIVRVP